MRPVFVYFSLIFLLSVSTTALAGLYDGKAQVQNQSNSQRKQAASRAMKQVLVRISGQRDIVKNDLVRSRLRQAESFIRQFAFHQQPDALIYTASFDQQKIDQLVKQAGFPIWSNRRPITLLWVVMENENGTQRVLLNETEYSAFKSQLMSIAEERGIELMFPLMDLQDNLQINVDDVWGRFDDTIKKASERYPVESIVAARVYRENTIEPEPIEPVSTQASSSVMGTFALSQPAKEVVTATDETAAAPPVWRIEWRLFDEEPADYQTRDLASSALLLDDFGHWLADYQAARFAVRADNDALGKLPTVLTVLNVNSLADYVGLQRFFESLTVVTKAELISQQDQVARFALSLVSNQQDLLNEIQLDGRIKRERDEFGQVRAALEFRWTP